MSNKKSRAKGSKNPAELPASRLNSGAGTEKRPFTNEIDINAVPKDVKQKKQKERDWHCSLALQFVAKIYLAPGRREVSCFASTSDSNVTSLPDWTEEFSGHLQPEPQLALSALIPRR
jgi:hypothetical protein